MKVNSLFPKGYKLDSGDKREVKKQNSKKAVKARNKNTLNVNKLDLYLYEGELGIIN